MDRKKENFSEPITVRVDARMRKRLRKQGKLEGLDEAVYARKLLYTHPELASPAKKGSRP